MFSSRRAAGRDRRTRLPNAQPSGLIVASTSSSHKTATPSHSLSPSSTASSLSSLSSLSSSSASSARVRDEESRQSRSSSSSSEKPARGSSSSSHEPSSSSSSTRASSRERSDYRSRSDRRSRSRAEERSSYSSRSSSARSARSRGGDHRSPARGSSSAASPPPRKSAAHDWEEEEKEEERRHENRNSRRSRDDSPTGQSRRSAAAASGETAPDDDEQAQQPLSVEAAIAKRDAERSDAAKPRFLSLAERQRLADEMRLEREREMQRHKQRLLEQHSEFLRLASTQQQSGDRRESRVVSDSHRDSREARDRRDSRDRDDRWRSRSRLDARDSSRDGDRSSRDGRESRSGPGALSADADSAEKTAKEERELEEIRARYLGGVKRKRKLIKPSERFKAANLHWDDDEDTSTNTMAEELPDYRPQFGRGFLGGIDQRLQIESFKMADERDSTKQRTKLESDRTLLAQLSERDRRGRHWSEKRLDEMTARDWRIFREDHRITTKGGNIPDPIRSWSESGLPPRLLDAVAAAQYDKPSPIQMQAIPIGLQGRDLLGIAETGSGKTAAFVLPMLCYVAAQPPMTAETMRDGPYALILAPTRELVIQIESEASRFGKAMGARTVSIVGGQSIEEQGILLRKGCEIVVATPGRLIDCLEQRYIALNQCNYVVLDEADRMVDMGFADQLATVLNAMPSVYLKSTDEEEAVRQEQARDRVYRTTVLFSATMPAAVERLSREYLRRPAHVTIGEAGSAADRVTQVVEWVPNEHRKRSRLAELLSESDPPVIVFVNTKRDCDVVWKAVRGLGYNPCKLHSGRTQDQREEALKGFREGIYDVLVGTDVAGRGIDVSGVTHVINWQLPAEIEKYTHRIGRTGRAGLKGLATSFLCNEDTNIMYDLLQMLKNSKQVVPKELREHPSAQAKPGTVQATRLF